ncbi:transposase [Micromonospora sp. NPDC050417]|uniref:transposase n=1 Tax=Micromonospora sp. NPDC050417 TaxID=3364280 RepID=UPI0037AC75BE
MSREEDDAVALVRVYCGLASADLSAGPASAGSTLTSAVVDDAGRLLHVGEIGDDPAGYAQLGALLVERSGGLSGVAIAADSDDHLVTSLLSAAGRPLAIADDDSVDDFAERFADDESQEEMEGSPAQRRAVGLARALQAGALSAVTLPAPRDLAGYKPVLAAHAALASGRHSAAGTLREVLRELYPAALRAYPDPADPVPLAVLDALPEPGMLTGAGGRGRESAVAVDAITAHLVADGVAEANEISEAVTALQVAIAETPRRATVNNKAVTSAVAEAVRQAVAAVRACDAGCDALVATLAARVTTPAPLAGRRTVRRGAEEAVPLAAGAHGTGSHGVLRPASQQPVPSVGRRSRPQPAPGSGVPSTPQPMTAPPVAPAPIAPPPLAPQPVVPAASLPGLNRPAAAPAAQPQRDLPTPVPAAPAPATQWRDAPANRPVSSPPPPPPGITPIVPVQRSGNVPPVDAGEPFRATLTTAAINSARSERRPTPIVPRPKTNRESAPTTNGFGATDLSVPVPTPRPDTTTPPPGSRANWPLVSPGDDRDERADRERADRERADRERAEQDRAERDRADRERADRERADRDLAERERSHAALGHGDYGRIERERNDRVERDRGERERGGRDLAASAEPAYQFDRQSSAGLDLPASTGAGDGRVTPPWLADDLPQEPPMLRLVEPQPLADRALREPADRALREPADRALREPADRALREPAGVNTNPHLDGPPLRLVEPEAPERNPRVTRAARRATEPSTPPVAEGDGDLLIFAAARSAWFTGHPEDDADVEWSSTADTGWRAAEQAARPQVGDETRAGLPRRVPQANLVPGSPLRDERPLRIVRDAARIAEHTTGYFRGWRRGQEIGGFAVGGRPGREAAGGWDFSRDHNDRDDDREYEYRSAGYRS